MFELLFFGGLLFVVTAIVIQCLPQSLRSLLPLSSDEVTLPPLYIWSVLLVVLAFNVFVYDSGTVAVGTGLFVAAVVIALFSALPRRKQTFFAYASMGIGVLASLAFAFRANEFVQSVNAVVALLSVGAMLLLNAVDRIEWNIAWFLRTAFFYPAVVFQRLPGAMRLLKPSKISGMSMFLRVLGITVVLVIFFAAILSSADPIFAEKIRVLREEIVPRTLWSVVLACLLMIALAATFSKSYTYKALPLRFLSWIETAVPVGAVCILFGIFLWVQATYLFADHEAFKALDLTYAEYVRKGMIEVLIATACAGVLSYIVSLKERELAGLRERGILYAINAVLLVELFLMLGSALKRDWMYMEVYGLTRVRIVGEVFLAWLAIIIALIAVFALWRRLQEKAVFAGAIAASFAVVLYLNVCNMDHTIAAAVPPAGQVQDVYYVSLLSTDAFAEWAPMIDDLAHEFEEIRQKTSLTPEEKIRLASIVRAVDELIAKRDIESGAYETNDWRSWTWSRWNARSFSRTYPFLKTLPCLESELADYRLRYGFDLVHEIGMLENEYRRPFVNGAASYNLTYVDGSSPDADVSSCL